MKTKLKLRTSILPAAIALLVLGFGISYISAQEHSRPAVNGALALSRKMGPEQRAHLSTGGANRLYLADSGALNHIDSSPSIQQAVRRQLARRLPGTAAAGSNLVPVNDPGFDYLLSRVAGFTQNGSANAWCGQNIVVGYNDSQALLLTSSLGMSYSASGVAVSHDGGTSFQASLFLNAGADVNNYLGGEPVIACAGKNFYYASLFDFSGPVDPATGAPTLLTGVGINRSGNGGDGWSAPIAAVKKNAEEHFVDKEWLTVDPNNPNNLYVTYTDSDYSLHPANGCDGGVRFAIELVSSKSAGFGWNRPVVVDQICNPARGQALQGSQVVVGNAGEVYVTWVAQTSVDEELFISRSVDGGQTFSSAAPVGSATLPGLGGTGKLQSLIQGNAFPSLSVDRSNGASRGALYLAWTDASGNQISDFLAPILSYGFGDVVFSRSLDKGDTWTPAAIVSPAPHNFTGGGRDQFLPSAAVDSEGTLAICYFDRRRDSENNGVDHYCSVSHDQGSSFTSIRNTPKPFTPAHSNDGLTNPVGFGDYDLVSSDANGVSPGFFSSFQSQATGNPDIVGVRF